PREALTDVDLPGAAQPGGAHGDDLGIGEVAVLVGAAHGAIGDGEVLLEPEAQTVRGRAPGWGGTGPLAHGSTGLVARAATVLFARAVADLLAPPSAGRLARPHAGLLAPPSAGRLARRHPLATECALLLARLLLGLRIVLEAVDDHPEGGVQQTVPDVGDVMVLADAAAIGDVGRESGRSRL